MNEAASEASAGASPEPKSARLHARSYRFIDALAADVREADVLECDYRARDH